MIESRFTESTQQVFRHLVLDGAEADSVARETGLSLNAVFTAKSRVLRELRRLGQGFGTPPKDWFLLSFHVHLVIRHVVIRTRHLQGFVQFQR
jgi:hypothetical protein